MRKAIIGAALLSSLSVQASAITFVNALAVPNGTDLSSGYGTGVNGSRFGGFGSDLVYDSATQTYYGMTDRGPGGGLLNYAPRIQAFTLATNSATGFTSSLSLTKTIVFTQKDGKTPFNGLNPTLLNGDSSKLGASFDPEGMVRRSNGNFLVSDEYGPSVYEFDSNGVFIRAFKTPDNILPKNGTTPNFTDGRPTITTGRQDNRGFEGLTLSNDGKTAYAVLQDPLVNEGDKDGRYSRNVRIVSFDVDTGEATKQSIYQLEDVNDINARVTANGGKGFDAKDQGRSIGVSSIVTLPNGQLMVLERDNRGVGVDDPTGAKVVGSKRVYLIDINAASDASDTDLTGTNVLPIDISSVSKSLLLDIQAALKDAGATVAEKMEGLSFGGYLDDGGISLFVVTDNDFSVTQDPLSTFQSDVCTTGFGGVSSIVPLDSGCTTGDLIPTYVYSFRLSAAEARALGFGGAVPEPGNWAMMIAGFGLIGAQMRNRRKNRIITA